METDKRKYGKPDIARLVVGHGAWVALIIAWGPLGIVFGGIFALLTSPKGLYD